MTYEEILNRMLYLIPSTIDKRQGSIIYNALSPAAIELASMYAELEKLRNSSYADTADGQFLTLRAEERGITRKTPTAALRRGIFNIPVITGSRFGIEDTTYIATETGTDITLRCEQLGEIGNIYNGTMLPITYVNGLTTCELTDILIPGEDEETDDSLRSRYFDNLESQAFAGNVADYKEKTKTLDGVGGVKVYPVWAGGGTVKLVIIDSTFNKPSNFLIDEIQTAIDPVLNSGEGLGIAPIGHVVTISAAEEVIVNIVSNITLVVGYIWDDVEPYIIDAVNNYFLNLRKTWDTEDNLVVRISQIESSILQVTGVLDIQNTTLNGSATNLILNDIQIPVLGTVIKS